MPEAPYLIWRCGVCGELYDEALGEPPAGVAPGVRFADLPASWLCPACGAAKANFSPYEH